MSDKKPMPVPCEKCGAAIEHDKRLCVYCLSKEPPRQVDIKIGDYELQGTYREGDAIVSGINVDACGMFKPIDAFDAIYLMASRAAFRRSTQNPEPWRKGRGR